MYTKGNWLDDPFVIAILGTKFLTTCVLVRQNNAQLRTITLRISKDQKKIPLFNVKFLGRPTSCLNFNGHWPLSKPELRIKNKAISISYINIADFYPNLLNKKYCNLIRFKPSSLPWPSYHLVPEFLLSVFPSKYVQYNIITYLKITIWVWQTCNC